MTGGTYLGSYSIVQVQYSKQVSFLPQLTGGIAARDVAAFLFFICWVNKKKS